MSTTNSFIARIPRRRFLATAGVGAMALAFPWKTGFAQQQPPRYRRRNLSAPGFDPRILESYKLAVFTMLQAPPTSPLNWYRNAFVHLFDCPHGNWWFLPWHRGYIGWFEQTCRYLSHDTNFALPYWDWTMEPRLPDFFFDGVLNPAQYAYYISTYDAFRSTFEKPMNDFWATLSAAQLAGLSVRGFNSMADVWAEIERVPIFLPKPEARALTRTDPFFDEETRNAVSIEMINDALAPVDFLEFGSAKKDSHNLPPSRSDFSILEGQPHNLVHNNVGGFMEEFLSPVDPIFFLHHSNIDRLWDVWTRKQLKYNLPIFPPESDLPLWENEPFLFFVDSSGTPVQKNKAGDYKTINGFDYDYEPGSGEDVIATPPVPAAAAMANHKMFRATLASQALTFRRASVASVAVPEAVLQAASAEKGGPHLYARITVQPPANTKGVRFHVLVNPPADATHISFASPSYAGTIEFFGSHRHGKNASEPVSFRMPLAKPLKALRAANMLKTSAPLRISVVPDWAGVSLTEFQSTLPDVSIGSF